MAQVSLNKVSKSFPGNIWAIRDINLGIENKEFVVFVGPSGCGKSTTLRIIAGLEEATEGDVYIGDQRVNQIPPKDRNIAMVFQNYALYPHMTVYENMAFGLRLRKYPKREISARVKEAATILGIEKLLQRRPRELSGGQRQRVAVGRAIVRKPLVFLFDEPLSNLDARLRAGLRGEFIKLHKRLKKTVIYVTHDQVEASVLGEVVVVLKEGKVQQIASPGELYKDPRNLFVAEFIGTPAMNIIKSTLERIDGSLILRNSDFKFKIPESLSRKIANYIGKTIYFGIRPSAIKIAPDGQIKGEVIFVETIGEDSFAHIALGEKIEIDVKIDSDIGLKSGGRASLAFNPEQMYFFDDSENRI